MCSYQPEPVIATARLTLRQARADDAARLGALCADFNLARLEQSDSLIVEHPEHGPIGAVGFDDKARYSELGCWIAVAHRGRGYATEAVGGALVWAHERWGRKVVQSGHLADNPASAGVLIKSGFLYTGDVELRPSPERGKPVPTRMMVWIA